MNEEYRSIKAANWSTLKHYFRSPAHVKAAIEAPDEKTAAMSLGAFVHEVLLEPTMLADTVAAPDFGDCRYKENKAKKAEFMEANKNKRIVSAEELKAAKTILENVYKHSTASKVFSDIIITEKVLQWDDFETGIACKGLADIWTNSGVLVDIKTTKDARYTQFQRQAENFGWLGQLAYYRRGLIANEYEVKGAMLIAIENSAPYAVNVYHVPNFVLDRYDPIIVAFLKKHKVCTEQDYWPGYDDELLTLELSDYHINYLEQVR